jgi:hypothetical protein
MEERTKSLKFKSYHVFYETAYSEGSEEKETVIFGIRSGVLSGNTHTRVERKIKHIAVNVSRSKMACKRNRNGKVSPSWLCISSPFSLNIFVIVSTL